MGTKSHLVARVTTHENGLGRGLYVCDIEFFQNCATLILVSSVQNPSASLAWTEDARTDLWARELAVEHGGDGWGMEVQVVLALNAKG